MVLNMLSTAVMVRLGHAYDNLMIDVGEANEKLRERATWILKEASARNVSAVTQALRHSGHDLRLALIMLKRGVSANKPAQSCRSHAGICAKPWRAAEPLASAKFSKWINSGYAAEKPLHGTVKISGAKNSALPAMAAALFDIRSGDAAQHSQGARHRHDEQAAGVYVGNVSAHEIPAESYTIETNR